MNEIKTKIKPLKLYTNSTKDDIFAYGYWLALHDAITDYNTPVTLTGMADILKESLILEIIISKAIDMRYLDQAKILIDQYNTLTPQHSKRKKRLLKLWSIAKHLENKGIQPDKNEFNTQTLTIKEMHNALKHNTLPEILQLIQQLRELK